MENGKIEDLLNKSNEDLCYIIRYTELKQQAWEQLLKNLNVTESVNEEELIQEIAKNVLDRPSGLEMGKWHCGTSHCLDGWACVLSPIAARIEKEYDTEAAGDAVLPNYSHLFFESNENVLEVLKNIQKSAF